MESCRAGPTTWEFYISVKYATCPKYDPSRYLSLAFDENTSISKAIQLNRQLQLGRNKWNLTHKRPAIMRLPPKDYEFKFEAGKRLA